VNFLEDRLNCGIVLPRLNVSPKGDLELSSASEALLRQKASPDFALYAAVDAAADQPYGALSKDHDQGAAD
jgi:hypothetical protein